MIKQNLNTSEVRADQVASTIVAMARQMAVDLWRWRAGRVPAQNFGWTMAGTEA